MDDVEGRDSWTCAVGRVAMGQGRVDEWLVQVLINLLAPLTPGIVESLVGADTVGKKCDRITTLIGRDEYVALAPAIVEDLRKTCAEIKKLDEERNRIVHSLYGPLGDTEHSRLSFRSRSNRERGRILTLSGVHDVADRYDTCAQQLEAAALAIENPEGSGIAQHVADLLELGFALVRAGHLAERHWMDAVTKSMDQGSLLRVAVDYPRYRVLCDFEACAPQESLITIDPTTWQIEIADPALEAPIHTGDTGWRDVTTHAREDDRDVEQAFLRRVGTNVRYLQRGGDLSALAQAQRRDLLAERCFGVPRQASFPMPMFLSALEGFSPAPEGPPSE